MSSENNNKKTYELEKEELILRLAATKQAEDLVKEYNDTENSDVLVTLGKLITEELIRNTEDKSGRYNLTKDEAKN